MPFPLLGPAQSLTPAAAAWLPAVGTLEHGEEALALAWLATPASGVAFSR